ncbi:hypothetical protein EJB05_17215, partial [Eragrostis curvula]
CSKDVINICGEITTSADKWVPWVSCGISVVVFLVPTKRVLMTLGERSKSHTLYWFFLVFSNLNFLAWTGFTVECKSNQSGYPVKVTSVIGIAIHTLLIIVSRNATRIEEVKNLRTAVGIGLHGFVMLVAFLAFPSFNGWFGLALGVLAHLFRMKATVYDQFDWLLFTTSLLGGVNGLVWLRHPNLCIMRQYKLASYIIAILRGWEVYLWCSPLIATALWKMDGGQASSSKKDEGQQAVSHRPRHHLLALLRLLLATAADALRRAGASGLQPSWRSPGPSRIPRAPQPPAPPGPSSSSSQATTAIMASPSSRSVPPRHLLEHLHAWMIHHKDGQTELRSHAAGEFSMVAVSLRRGDARP